MTSWPLQIYPPPPLCVGDLWPLADRVWWRLVSVCPRELLLEASSISSALPKLNPTLSISPLKMLPFLFSLLISLLNDVFLFLSILLFLFSYSFLFITRSSPSSSLTFPLQPPSLPSSPSPSTQEPEESSLTRNTPILASSISCDGSGGLGSPCAPLSPWVRVPTSIGTGCTIPGRNCRSYPWRPSWHRPRRISLRIYPAPCADTIQDSESLIS